MRTDPLPGLQGFELVTHLFLGADDGHRARDLWSSYLDEYEELTVSAGQRPLDPAAIRASNGPILATARNSGPDLHQVVLRREHDEIWLSAIQAPTGDVGWPYLESKWARFSGAVDSALESARVLQARTRRLTAPDPIELADMVRTASALPGDWALRGATWSDDRLGSFAVWEAPSPDLVANDDDARRHRRLVVVAADDRDPELSAWTWSRGDAEPTPLSLYLLHAAKLRRYYRIQAKRSDGEAVRTAEKRVDRVLHLSKGMISDSPNSVDLGAVSDSLTELTDAELGLVDSLSALRAIQGSAGITGRNMARYAGTAKEGPFDDDRRLAEWLHQQLDNDRASLDTALQQVRSVARLVDPLVQRGLHEADERLQRTAQRARENLQGRRERFNLALTGLVGALLMALAAIQAFGYKPPIPALAVPAAVATLTAFALLMSMILVDISRSSRASGRAVLLAAGVLGAACGWLTRSWVGPAPLITTWASAGVGTAIAVMIEVARRRHRRGPSTT